MNICGIIAEYNPFHNGHAYQLAAARQAGATHVVCVMSGHFTQRGEAAVADKLTRARCALAAGADVVVELPVVYALSSAAHFARGGVGILNAMGCVDTLHFGSECGNVNALLETAQIIRKLEATGAVNAGSGMAGLARGEALAANGYEAQARLLEQPNNLLGVEYLLALHRLYAHITPQTVARTGVGHDQAETDGNVCSASQLRRLLRQAPTEAERFMPRTTVELLAQAAREGRFPLWTEALETAIISRLRMGDAAYFARVAGVSEGLENRMVEAIRTGQTLEQIAAAVKSKRYPLSRIRRILLCAAIGITGADTAAEPAYIRVLGMRDTGADVLRRLRTTARLPVISRASDLQGLSPVGKRQFRLESAAADLYEMGRDPIGPCGTEYTRNIYSYTKGGQK